MEACPRRQAECAETVSGEETRKSAICDHAKKAAYQESNPTLPFTMKKRLPYSRH
jgi:hypothetical protein